jgi:hypothetical protein
MTVLIYVTTIGALICVIAFGLSRERTRAKAAIAVRDQLSADHGLDEAYVSGEDDSMIGLSRKLMVLVVGTTSAQRRIPFHAIRSVEGLRDGVVMVRTDREAAAAGPALENGPLPPQTIRSLTLRITVDDPEPTAHSVLFLDGGKQGLEPHNTHLLQQAALTEAWYRRVVEVMPRTTAAEPA